MASKTVTTESHTSNDDAFNAENILRLAGSGLEYMKNKYSKERINSGEAMIEFLKFKETYNNKNEEERHLYLKLLCLAMSMINQTETIDVETRNKMITGIMKHYVEHS